MLFIDQLTKRLNPGHDIDLDAMGISPITFLGRGAIVAMLPKTSILTARMNNGMVIRGRNQAGFGGRGVFMFRDAVEPELALLKLLLAPGDLFVDVGSCVGSYTVTAAKILNDTGGVFAIDPNPDSMAILRDTLAINKLSNVMLVCGAVADKLGFTEFDVEAARPDTRGIDDAPATCAQTLNRVVPTTTIDHVIAEVDLTGRVRMMKIDAEGAETLVLNGARDTIAQHSPVLILETAITNTPTLPGYVAYHAQGSRNTVLVHDSDTEAQTKLHSDTGFAPVASD